MTTKEAGADRRALAAGMMRLLGLSAGYGETNKYVEQPPPKLTVAAPVQREVTEYFEVTGPVQPIVSVHIQPEDLAAEFTDALYPQVLRRRPKHRWIDVELALWKALTENVEAWARQRPPSAASNGFDVWWECLLHRPGERDS